MIGRDVGGKSLFAILIQGWSVNRKPELIDSLKWLANHGGMHFYGPEDRPIWEYVFRGPRPNRRQDQIQDSYLLEFLLGLEAFSSRINEKASNDTTLLHVLAGGGHVEAMRVLLKRSDVDLNAGFSFTTPYGSSYREFSTSNWTALDLAISLLGVSGAYPPSIESGGKLEIHKWVQDIRSIIKQLKDKAGKNYKIGKLQQHIEEKAAKQREMLLRDGLPFSTRRRNFHGGWPQPLSSSKPTQEVEEETGMKYPPEEVLDDLLLGTLSEDLEATQRQLFLDAESMYRPLYGFRSELEANEHFKREAELQRKTWRLPPEWVLISVNGEKEKTSFVNIDTGEIVNKKPALYRGERDRISSYDRKGKGKETTPVDKSPGNHYVFINAMPQMTPIVIDIEETPRPEINFDSDETAEKVAHALGIFDQDITSLRETLLDKLLQEMAIDYKFECRETWWRG
ncbi:serine/threonine protein kinase [Daldinia childiae]|uniref:serine/threonine protein kinase n=1 Tax=Daldinia childiae TaxID=326645 RepID=UPI001447E6A8|nr:serine/threonine protein kinase [Daldinia childiae]KAF3059574.1 serine/threonine protein kinase [Daldinia childiae]